jgi:hypothetical protein
VRLLPSTAGPRDTKAYVQYETVSAATTARDALDGFQIDKLVFIKVSYRQP